MIRLEHSGLFSSSIFYSRPGEYPLALLIQIILRIFIPIHFNNKETHMI